MLLWQGHEADSYIINHAACVEHVSVNDATHSRTGMTVGASSPSQLLSTPDWAPLNELWHRFNYNADFAGTYAHWFIENAAGRQLQLLNVAGNKYQFQLWDGFAWNFIGTAFSNTDGKQRFDIRVVGGSSGKLQCYYGSPGAQQLVVDLNISLPTGYLRVGHVGCAFGGGFRNYVANEIVATKPTLSMLTESKFPISNGIDADGTGSWASVDEQQWDDLDFIALTAGGQRQSYKANARTQSQEVVEGITISCRAWYETDGPGGIRPYLVIGGTRYYGTTMALGLIPTGYTFSWSLNPATGAQFTPAQANDATLEWGWEAV